MRINNPFVITPNSVFTAALQSASVTQSKLADAATVYGGRKVYNVSGSFTAPYTKEYLIEVVGGGAGGCSGAGYSASLGVNYYGGRGGNAGQSRVITATLVAGTAYVVYVGDGGQGGVADASGGGNTVGSDGSDSILYPIVTGVGGKSSLVVYPSTPGDRYQCSGKPGIGLNAAGHTPIASIAPTQTSGSNAVGYGGGGGGGSSQWGAADGSLGGDGGNGAAGLVVIVW